ncbi:MAG TPA: hypothetical protein VHP58_04045 [Alphaproteobacteria bacterium]|nr:hypothetical protein [Alphaproteobacteria bacterium]
MLESSYLAHYSLAVAVTFGLLALLGWLAANYGQKIRNLPRGSWMKPAEGDFTVLGRLSLGAQHQLHHVRWKGTDLLIATHPQGTTTVSSSPSPAKTKSKK